MSKKSQVRQNQGRLKQVEDEVSMTVKGDGGKRQWKEHSMLKKKGHLS